MTAAIIGASKPDIRRMTAKAARTKIAIVAQSASSRRRLEKAFIAVRP